MRRALHPKAPCAQFCSGRCRTAAYGGRQAPTPTVRWLVGGRLSRISRSLNSDGTQALSRAELGEHLLRIAADGEPKTGRRFYYLALSHGYIRPDMSASPEGKASREAAYNRVTSVLGDLRKSGRLRWGIVLDLTRDLDEWQMFESPREARAAMRRQYDEDRWLGQPWYPILLVEKDTMEPVCRPMAMEWQMPFASSRGYGSLKLQHDVAVMLKRRHAQTGQMGMVFFISDLDPSGLDLQRAWETAMLHFGVSCSFERIALRPHQVIEFDHLAIEVKASDSRSKHYIESFGDRCWEVDILPDHVINTELREHVFGSLDVKAWGRREADIERARALL